MFEKKNRYSFRKGVPKLLFTSQFLVIRYQKHEDSVLRCSVVVGKKVDKRAVARNKIKRLFVSHIKELLDDTMPYELVIYARKGAGELTSEQVVEELKNAFNAMRITNK